MERFHETAGASLRAQKQMRAALLHLVPIVERAVDAIEIDCALAVRETLPGLSTQQIGIIFIAQGREILRHEHPTLRIEGYMGFDIFYRLR